jgi:Tol biopolymer transport system component
MNAALRRSLRCSAARLVAFAVLALTAAAAPASPQAAAQAPTAKPAAPSSVALSAETRLANVRQLTFGGENAEAYFSFDGKWLSFQSTRDALGCDQIFVMRTDGTGLRMVSSGAGRTTCAYFLPDGKKVLYASTHLGGDGCPPKPDFSRGYVWALYADYDIFTKDLRSGAVTRLTSTPGYDAEATIAPDGKRIVFTSVRDGDLDLYSMRLDGSGVQRLTSEPGYDGGAFYSPDSKMIVYRASRPADDAALGRYRELLAKGLIEPRALEIWVMNADGSGKRQVTANGAANFAPFFTPDGKRIIFSSNLSDPKGRNFDIYLVNVDGSGLERVTYNDTFDGFPMFSPDGKKLVFASNRAAAKPGDTNVFIADWKD